MAGRKQPVSYLPPRLTIPLPLVRDNGDVCGKVQNWSCDLSLQLKNLHFYPASLRVRILDGSKFGLFRIYSVVQTGAGVGTNSRQPRAILLITGMAFGGAEVTVIGLASNSQITTQTDG